MSITSQTHRLFTAILPLGSRWLPLLAIVAIVVCGGWLTTGMAQDKAPTRASLPAPPEDVRQAMTGGDTAQAIELLDALLVAKPESADLWAFYRGVAYQNAGSWSEAEAAFKEFPGAYPDSPWILQATYRRAAIAQKTRDFQRAEVIYRDAAARLLSEGRQAELAGIYNGLADLMAAPRNPTDPQSPQPRHAQAAELYSKAYALHATTDVRAHAAFAMGRSFQALNNHAQATVHFAAFLELVPDETNHKHWEARLAHAHSTGLGYSARLQRRALQDLLRAGSNQIESDGLDAELAQTIQRAMAQAQHRMGDSWLTSSRIPLAISAWEKTLELYPAYIEAPSIAISIARHTSGEEQLLAWDRVLQTKLNEETLAQLSPEDRETQRASHELRLRASLFAKAQALDNRGRFADAIRVFSEYTRRYPDGVNWSEAQQNILNAELSIAKQARKEGRFADAREGYQQYLSRHPLDKAVARIQLVIGTTYIEEAKEGESAADSKTLFRKAIAQWELCAASNGTNETSSKALFRIADTFENELLDAGAAVKAYRNVTFGTHAVQARNRLEEMVRTSLSVKTERTARANEPVRIKVQTRNIENIEVHVHALDLESYFRKHLTHAKVEDLDLDLIAPEQRFDHSILDYSQYSPMEFQLDVPVLGPGVWVVSVIGGEKRATTLVLSSDLDLIIKATHQDVFVFVQDMLKGTPAAGVEVLLSVESDGSQKIVSVTTGPDGVATWTPKAPHKSNQNLHALALSNGNVASTAFDNHNLKTGQRLAPKSVIYSERPAYRPGETVHWRAIALKTNDGQWDAAQDTVAQIELTGPGGRIYRKHVAALSARGSVHGSFPLPEDTQVGRWSLRFSGKDLETTQCRFEVESFRMPLAEVILTADKNFAWRGNQVTITAQARTTYGAPLANTLLIWRIPGHGQQEVRTDATGTAEYVLETQEYGEAQILTVGASLPTENVHGAARVQLAVSGFGASVKLERELELAGTTFPVTVTTTAPDGNPVGRTLTLKVKRNSSPAEGRWKEEILLEKEVRTDPTTGKVAVPIEISQGGQVMITVQGRDQFGQRIEASTSLKISGTDDVTKLRLLTHNTSLDLGQLGRIQAINRAGSGLALMTLETDRVVEYRLVHLKQGSNEFQFQTQGLHVPSLNVALAFMDGHSFHESSARFFVRARLNLEVLPAAVSTAPGSSTRITIRATDGSGQPVQGEFSLAAVEESLFQLYPARNLDLSKHFTHPIRAFPNISTRSTCEFSYTGATQAIAQGLLEEAKRVERDQNWKRARKQLLASPSAAAPGGDDWMLGEEMVQEEAEEMDGFNDMIGIGGAAGGSFGGRSGGRRSLTARGGGRSDDGPMGPPESPTALWLAQVTTDANGVGVVDAVWPERSTRWRLTAHGIADGNRFGSATSHVTTQSDFFVELIAPPLLVAGDRPQVRVKLHDSAMQDGTANIELQVLTLSGPTILKAEVQLGVSAIIEHTFPLLAQLAGPQDMQVTVVATTDRNSIQLQAASTREIHVQPKGWQQVMSRSGTLGDQIQLNMDLAGTGRTLELHFGVTLEDDLIRQALGLAQFPSTCRWNGGHVQQASDLMAASAVFAAMQGQSGHPAFTDLQNRIEGLVASLSAGQLPSGGWPWNRQDMEADAHSTAHVTLALSQATNLGFPMDTDGRKRLARQLNSFVQVAVATDFEVRTHLQHALSSMGSEDFAALNRLYRSRAQMSTASKAHLALALAAAKRAPMASEIVSELESAAMQSEAQTFWKPAYKASWVTSKVETTALVALAMHAAKRPASESKAACKFLTTQRPWPTPRMRGYAIQALAQQGLQKLPGQANGFVSVHVAGQEPTRVALTSQPNHRHSMLRFDLPDAVAGSRKTKVSIDLGLSGNILPQYTAILKGHVQEPPVQKATPFTVQSRLFLASPARYEGQLMPAGFNTVVEEQRWRNERRQVEAGEIVHLEVSARRNYTKDAELNNRLEYLELQVPIPSGLEIFDAKRPSERPYRLIGNSLVFPLGPLNDRRPNRSFKVSLVAMHPGVYPAARVLLRSAYHPELLAVSEATEVTLLPAGALTTDRYRMTPDESFHFGKSLFEDKKFVRARGHLLPLLDEFESKLRPAYLKDTARMLLFASLDSGTPNEIVRYFEIIKQREPDLFIPIDQVLKIGAAYALLGEHERAMLIFRAALNESFGKDLQIVGLLDQQNHWLMATRLLDRLIGEYPSLPIVVETDLTLADRVLQEAPQAHDRNDLRQAGADRAALTGMGIQRLKRFLSLYPNSPLSADAALNLVSAYFDLEDHKSAAALCEEMAPLYKEPVYFDAFRYSGAVSSWYLGLDDKALVELLAISEAKYKQANSTSIYSPNRDLAKYIMAQIYHARKEVVPATEYYQAIDDQFPDAALALESMLNLELHIQEEVLRVHPGEPVELTLTHRNLAEAELLVYPVDLMTLYLREKDLSRVTQVNLAGVSPKFRGTIELPKGADLRSQELKTSLPLSEPGAYLVILRGGSLHASSLVLVSDIELDVNEYEDGTVRVQVSGHEQDAFLKDVDVRIIGSDDGRFSIGKTDLRGLFSVGSVRGKATIIARKGHNHFAFHRGSKSLLNDQRKQKDDRQSVTNPDQAFFFSNVLDMNQFSGQVRSQNLDKEIQADRKGVQVLQVK